MLASWRTLQYIAACGLIWASASLYSSDIAPIPSPTPSPWLSPLFEPRWALSLDRLSSARHESASQALVSAKMGLPSMWEMGLSGGAAKMGGRAGYPTVSCSAKKQFSNDLDVGSGGIAIASVLDLSWASKDRVRAQLFPEWTPLSGAAAVAFGKHLWLDGGSRYCQLYAALQWRQSFIRAQAALEGSAAFAFFWNKRYTAAVHAVGSESVGSGWGASRCLRPKFIQVGFECAFAASPLSSLRLSCLRRSYSTVRGPTVYAISLSYTRLFSI